MNFHHDISFSFSFPWSSSKWSTLGKIDWPKGLESVAKDLIRKLLVIDRTKRIGNLKNGADDIKNHKWFKGKKKMSKWQIFSLLFSGIDWEDVYNKKLKPPFVPKVSSDGDTSNFQVHYNKWKGKWWKLKYIGILWWGAGDWPSHWKRGENLPGVLDGRFSPRPWPILINDSSHTLISFLID